MLALVMYPTRRVNWYELRLGGAPAISRGARDRRYSDELLKLHPCFVQSPRGRRCPPWAGALYVAARAAWLEIVFGRFLSAICRGPSRAERSCRSATCTWRSRRRRVLVETFGRFAELQPDIVVMTGDFMSHRDRVF